MIVKQDCEGQNCWAHLDWHCEHAGLCRVFEGSNKFGDSYCYALPFVVRERFDKPDENGKIGFIEFVGVQVVMKPCQYRAMRTAMRIAGWRILSTSKHSGKTRTIEICNRIKIPKKVLDENENVRTIEVK